MTVIGLVAVCDYVTEEERRIALVGPDPVWTDPPPAPAVPEPATYGPRTPEELEQFLAPSRGMASFSVHEFAILADGSRLQLHHDRGFGTSTHGPGGRLDPWTDLTLERIEQNALMTVLPDEDDGEDHPWEWLASLIRALGVEVMPEELKRVPYTVEFSERLRERVPPSG